MTDPDPDVLTFPASQGGCRRCGHLYGTKHRGGPCAAPGCDCPWFQDGLGGPMAWALLFSMMFAFGLLVLIIGSG